MKWATVAMMTAMAVVLSVPASALTTVDDGSNPGSELDVYQIYNHFYGTSFSSTAGSGSPFLGTGGMDELQLDPDEIFSLDEDGAAVFLARYAGSQQRFGYYTNTDDPSLDGAPTDPDGVDGDFHTLFTITTIGLDDSASTVGILTAADSPLGFFDQHVQTGRTWYSQVDRNLDDVDHMIAFRVLIEDPDNAGQFLVDENRLLLAFEDLRMGEFGSSDEDFNDLMVEVFIPGGLDPEDPVAEPATAGLMLIGLAAAALRRRFAA